MVEVISHGSWARFCRKSPGAAGYRVDMPANCFSRALHQEKPTKTLSTSPGSRNGPQSVIPTLPASESATASISAARVTIAAIRT